MLRDLYLKLADEMMNHADDRIREAAEFTEKAEYYIKMADETESEELISCLKGIRKEFNITAEKIAKNLGVSRNTFANYFANVGNISFARMTRWLEAMGLEFTIIDPKGKVHRISKKEYAIKKGNPFLKHRKHTDNNPNVWFNK